MNAIARNLRQRHLLPTRQRLQSTISRCLRHEDEPSSLWWLSLIRGYRNSHGDSVFLLSALFVSNARPAHVLRTNYGISLCFGGNSIGCTIQAIAVNDNVVPQYCAVSSLESELDLGRRRRLVGCSDDGRARRERGRHMEVALTQAERTAQARRQWRWAARGSRRSRGCWRGCGRRLRARVEFSPTWALAVRFCE